VRSEVMEPPAPRHRHSDRWAIPAHAGDNDAGGYGILKDLFSQTRRFAGLRSRRTYPVLVSITRANGLRSYCCPRSCFQDSKDSSWRASGPVDGLAREPVDVG
jgi:hypothetical protein